MLLLNPKGLHVYSLQFPLLTGSTIVELVRKCTSRCIDDQECGVSVVLDLAMYMSMLEGTLGSWSQSLSVKVPTTHLRWPK